MLCSNATDACPGHDRLHGLTARRCDGFGHGQTCFLKRGAWRFFIRAAFHRMNTSRLPSVLLSLPHATLPKDLVRASKPNRLFHISYTAPMTACREPSHFSSLYAKRHAAPQPTPRSGRPLVIHIDPSLSVFRELKRRETPTSSLISGSRVPRQEEAVHRSAVSSRVQEEDTDWDRRDRTHWRFPHFDFDSTGLRSAACSYFSEAAEWPERPAAWCDGPERSQRGIDEAEGV